ncbi:MAG: ATP-binding cassette domain-containing protein, partial [Chloroflexota bacterium]
LGVEDQGCVAIVGPSGSGKSTIGRVMNALLRPAEGTVELDGVNLHDMPNLAAARRRVCVLMQQPDNGLFGVTVGDDIRFGPMQAGFDSDESTERMIAAMARVGLDRDAFVARSPFSLSGGERRRVALAGLLAMQPQHLVLDEPVAGLDPAGRAGIEQVITQLSGELSVILLTADLPLALRLADRLVLIEHGNLLFTGAPGEGVADRELLARLRLIVPPQADLLDRMRERGAQIPPTADLRPETVLQAITAAVRAPRVLAAVKEAESC